MGNNHHKSNDEELRALVMSAVAEMSTAVEQFQQAVLGKAAPDGRIGYRVMTGDQVELILELIDQAMAQLYMTKAPGLRWWRTHHIDQDIKSQVKKLWNIVHRSSDVDQV